MSTPPSPASLKLNRERRKLKAAITIIALIVIMLLGSAVMFSNIYHALTAMAFAMSISLTVLPPLTAKYLRDYAF